MMNGSSAIFLVIMALEVVRRADDERRREQCVDADGIGRTLNTAADKQPGGGSRCFTDRAMALPECALHNSSSLLSVLGAPADPS